VLIRCYYNIIDSTSLGPNWLKALANGLDIYKNNFHHAGPHYIVYTGLCDELISFYIIASISPSSNAEEVLILHPYTHADVSSD